jgi:uracil-DNA glycosylase
MIVDLPETWLSVLGDELAKPYFKTLIQFVDDQRVGFPDSIYPREDQVFSAFKATPFDKVRVVLLGQDPYPGKGMAHGLCFSVEESVRKLPASLKNIFKELHSDVGVPMPNNGSLLPWAAQGVFLLNTILTVKAAAPLSHKGKGWETFKDEVIRQVNAKSDRVIFVLWGKPAQSKAALIDAERHFVLTSAHPSPLSARKFFGSRPFSTINALLQVDGRTEIDWKI